MRITVLLASALGGLALVGAGVIPSAPVGADCVGPTIEHTTGTIDRGATIRVEGTRWGRFGGPDECSVVGPLSDITVVVVQGGAEHVIAVGDADENDAFVVEAPLPADLEPGLADVRAGSPLNPQSQDASRVRLFVSDAPAPAPTAGGPVRFGPADAPPPAAADANVGDDGSGSGAGRRPAMAIVIAVVAGLAGVVVALFRRRRAPS